MSRNNIIIVAKYRGKYYVIPNLCAEIPIGFDSYDFYIKSFIKQESKFTKDLGKALIIAHRKQARINTEYGVHIEYLKK